MCIDRLVQILSLDYVCAIQRCSCVMSCVIEGVGAGVCMLDLEVVLFWTSSCLVACARGRGCRRGFIAVSHSLATRNTEASSTCLCQSKCRHKTDKICATSKGCILIHHYCRYEMDAVKSYTKDTDGAAGQFFTANKHWICRKATAEDIPEHWAMRSLSCGAW